MARLHDDQCLRDRLLTLSSLVSCNESFDIAIAGPVMTTTIRITAQDDQVTREPQHRRVIDTRGFLRSDGLWEIEGTLIDTKAYVLPMEDRDDMAIGEHLHHMVFTLVVDSRMVIQVAHARTLSAPYQDCGEAAEVYQELAGVRIKSGWMDEVKQRLTTVRRCTHLTEMLPILATAVFQTIWGHDIKHNPNSVTDRRSIVENSCHGYRPDGRAAGIFWSTADQPDSI